MAKVINKNEFASKTDYNIPTFGVKSSLALILAGALSTVFIPLLFSLIGIDKRISIVIGNTVILGFALAYTRFFIESKRGFCKQFWYTYAGFGTMFGFISFFWIYLNAYV